MIWKNIANYYDNQPVFSKERVLFDFLSAYFHQDADLDDRVVIQEFIQETDKHTIDLLCEAIDELIKTNKFTEIEKREFISNETSYNTSPENAFEWLLEMKELLKKYTKDDLN